MREASYSDADGRLWAVLIPDGEPDYRAHLGIPIGPVDLRDYARERSWPLDYEVAVHNQLYHRRIFPSEDERALRARIPDLIQAFNKAAKISALGVIELIVRDPAILPIDEGGPPDLEEQGGSDGQ